jgi:hypothetical protein
VTARRRRIESNPIHKRAQSSPILGKEKRVMAERMRCRRLALVVAALGLLAWPADRDVQAQPPTQKVDEMKVEPPPAMPAPPGGGSQFGPAPSMVSTFTPLERFKFRISPLTPLKNLLPAAPQAQAPNGPLTGDDLNKVPEVAFEAARMQKVGGQQATRQIAHQVAKINHLNQKKTDGFLEALRARRGDLLGLSFAMGDACRTTGERSKLFNLAVQTVRSALSTGETEVPLSSFELSKISFGVSVSPRTVAPEPSAPPVVREDQKVNQTNNKLDGFWDRYLTACAKEDKTQARVNSAQCEHIILARVAALMQMLATESPDLRLGLVKYLAGVSHVEATRALARLAVFSIEDEVHRAAVEALMVRRERDYSDVLVKGLRYPYPAVARRAADAIAKLDRKDLLPQLVALLEEPDPRAPIEEKAGGKRVPVVRELVRVNHHRNCLLCHAPGNTDTVSPDTLTAGVPIPGEPLAPPSRGYQPSSPDVVVRIDVTYLRQDFSLLQPVADANPWPEMQRFDFLVRTRTLTDEEANTYREQLEPREEGRLSPYRRAALTALRELTGLEAAPTAEAWRRLLKLPGRGG